MWQLESEATSASSGSTPAGSEKGIRTTLGDDEAGTTAPPSNAQLCARLYLPSVNRSSGLAAPVDGCGVGGHGLAP